MMPCILGDVCDFINGGAWSDKEYVESGLPVLKVTNCKNSGFVLDTISYLSMESAEKYAKNKLNVGDVIIATVGSHPNLKESAAGRASIVDSSVKGFYLNQNAVCLRTKDASILSQGYLGYLSKTHSFQHYIQMRGRGAANQMRIAISSIKEYSFDLPCLALQCKIADILSAYDNLIENNQKQIKLLEEAAQRLYKQWFIDLKFPGHETTKIIDGLPEGWKKECVGNLIKKIDRTKQIEAKDYRLEGKIPVIDQSRNFIAGYTDDLDSVVKEPSPVIVFGDHTRILKYIQFPFAKGADGTQLIVTNTECMPQSLFYCSLINVDLSNYHYARHFKYLKAEEIVVPNVQIAKKFDEIISVFFNQIQVCRNQMYFAQNSRDRLLPKLMSGEIDVSNLDL